MLNKKIDFKYEIKLSHIIILDNYIYIYIYIYICTKICMGYLPTRFNLITIFTTF